jgi:hypothetical protein
MIKQNWILAVVCMIGAAQVELKAELRAGCSFVDITPHTFPVLVNGGMLSRSLAKVKTSVNARALVLSDKVETVAIVVVDSCMMGRAFLDDVKAEAAKRLGIRTDLRNSLPQRSCLDGMFGDRSGFAIRAFFEGEDP